jgi:hypothetical protein
MATLVVPCAHTASLLILRAAVRGAVVFAALALVMLGVSLMAGGLGTGPSVADYGSALGGLALALAGSALLLARAAAASSR